MVFAHTKTIELAAHTLTRTRDTPHGQNYTTNGTKKAMKRKEKTEKLCRVTLSSNIFPSDNESIQFTTERKSCRAVVCMPSQRRAFSCETNLCFLATTTDDDGRRHRARGKQTLSLVFVWPNWRMCMSHVWVRTLFIYAENGDKSANRVDLFMIFCGTFHNDTAIH